MFEKPTDSVPPTSARRPSNTIGIIGLAVAIVGLVAGIGWDWYKEKRSLQLELISGVPIINPIETRPEGVQVTFRGVEVENASTLVFKLTNTGRTSILREEVREPVKIAFKDSRVLDARIVSTSPPNLMVNVANDANAQAVTLDFDLINRGESVTISVLVTLIGNNFTWDASSRIVGFSDLDIVLPTRESQSKTPRVTVVSVALASLYLMFFSGAAMWHARLQRRLSRAVKQGRITLPTNATADEMLSFITTVFGKFGAFRNTRILETLGHLQFDQPIDEPTRVALLKDIEVSVARVWKPLWLSFLLVIVGAGGLALLVGRYIG